MTTLAVYDPAICCSTGICGTDVDLRPIDLAADLDWLKAQGVTVRRYGLSREPAEFAANETIRQIMQDSEGDDLPEKDKAGLCCWGRMEPGKSADYR